MSIYIKKRADRLTIRIPVKKNPYLIIPLLGLVGVWIPFLLFFVEKSLTINDFKFHLFWTVGLSSWFILGTLGISVLIWLLFGYEEIKIHGELVLISKPLIFYVRNNFYEKSTMKEIRLDKEIFKARKDGEWQEKTRNIIRIETPGKTVSFARGIESHDGETIIINLASSGLLNQNQFQIIQKA